MQKVISPFLIIHKTNKTGCINMKLHIPNDFSVAGFEDSSELKHLSVPVTAMHIPANFPGETAVNALLAMLNNDPLSMPRVLQHRLCTRNTVIVRP